jgi:beta-mannosidase
VDYISDIFLNSHHLGRHEGMFSPQVYDITDLLEPSNRLAVRIQGSRWLPQDRSTALERLLNRIEISMSSLSSSFPHRRDTLKCQMGFGWDFAPPLRTMGLWDDVYAIATGDVFIRHAAIRQQWTGDEVVLAIELEVDAARACQVQLRCTLVPETFDGQPSETGQTIDLPSGTSRHSVELTPAETRLWWPWDHGRPDLYCLRAEIWKGKHLLDSLDETVGLRQLAIEGRTLYVNGRRVYARGANWVPADILPGRVRQADYEALLSFACQANMNMLRVWGGGLREKRAFYALCDRMGILVWQEFPLACAFLARFPRSPEYLRLVESEAGAIVRDLRNHPSLAVWCGGNEFDPRRNAPLVAVLQRVVSGEDPDRPFLAASPAEGDSHNWQVWHNFLPPSAYCDDEALFASEFGLQAPPVEDDLRRFIPDDEAWPPGSSWALHGAGLKKLVRYARPFLPTGPASMNAFLEASQRAQAHGLQIAIEHYRRRKACGCGGVLVWQLNEPWPAISWALVGYYRQPKPAYQVVKRLFNPLLISADYRLKHYQAGDKFRADLWLVNDTAQDIPGCQAEISLWDEAGEQRLCLTEAVAVAADSAQIAGSVCWTLPSGNGWRLTCRLLQDGEPLASNGYDLTVHDDIQPSPRQRLWAWLSSLVMPS